MVIVAVMVVDSGRIEVYPWSDYWRRLSLLNRHQLYLGVFLSCQSFILGLLFEVGVLAAA